MGQERRRWKRRSLDSTILFRPVKAGGPFRSGRMRDISDGGVAFDTDDPPEHETLVDMYFKEHDNAADQRVRGSVVWVQEQPGGRWSVGVGFVG